MKRLLLLPIYILLFTSYSYEQTALINKPAIDSITKIEMHLSAFGVESDDFPSIDVIIDLKADSSFCRKSFDNPKYKSSSYTLTKKDIQAISNLLYRSDLGKLKKEYKVNMTDLPSSRTIIYTRKSKIIIDDYGLEGDYPLKELYKIAYKF
jgi:hypothetical protein